jgi:hypothetical protein
MNGSTQCAYRLVPRGGAGLACDAEGLALGGVDLARTLTDGDGVRRCTMRAPAEIDKVLRAAYGPQRDETVQRLHQGLGRAAAWIEAGDLGRAGVQAVMLGFPDLAQDAARKLTAIADLEKAGAAWETEARVSANNAGGGQWTTGGGGGAPALAATPSSNVQPNKQVRSRAGATSAAHPKPTRRPAATAQTISPSRPPLMDGAPSLRPIEVSVVTPMAPAMSARPQSRPNVSSTMPVPKAVAPLSAFGLVGLAATWLHDWDVYRAQQAVDEAITRFKLDRDRPETQTAAMAYVWSKHYLPALIPDVPYHGPELDAASQAVMRAALIYPGPFNAMLTGENAKAYGLNLPLITAAANAGLANYLSESRRRPEGVDPRLQTTSAAARKAIGLRLNDGRMQAHHLIPANVWKKNEDIALLALEAGWEHTAASNLIALPTNTANQSEFAEETGLFLPIHWGSHPNYDNATLSEIRRLRSNFPINLTQQNAKAIFQDVEEINRTAIISRKLGAFMKVQYA